MAENYNEKLKDFMSRQSWTELPEKEQKHDRPTPDEYFMKMAHLVKERATCPRRKVGAVIVKNKHLLSTGYNGNPKGMKHCDEIGCLREDLNVPSGERHELCLPKGMQIITKEGAKPIEEITEGEFVLTHRGRFKKVVKTFKRQYEGNLIHLTPYYTNIPIICTPQHPVLAIKTAKCPKWRRVVCKKTCVDTKETTRYFRNRKASYSFVPCKIKVFEKYENEWIKAKDLKINDFVLFPRFNGWNLKGEFLTEGITKLPFAKSIPKFLTISKKLMRLIGYYIAEGWVSNHTVLFGFHKKEKKLQNEVKSLMKDVFGVEAGKDHVQKEQKGLSIRFHSINLAMFFKENFGTGAENKCLPFWMLSLDNNLLSEFFNTYWLGDGSLQTTAGRSAKRIRWSTVSKNLAIQLKIILARLGFISRLRLSCRGEEGYIQNRKVRIRPVYSMTLSGKQLKNADEIIGRNIYKDSFKKSFQYGYVDEEFVHYPIRKIQTKKFKGNVYNLEVEQDNSYVTPAGIVHNCTGLHAEQNAILQAALFGVSIKNAKMYCTNSPCSVCAKMLINAGIKELVYDDGYADELAMKMLNESNVKVSRFEK